MHPAEATPRMQIAEPAQNAIAAGFKPQTATQPFVPIGQARRTSGTGSASDAESDQRIELSDHAVDQFKVVRNCGKPRGDL
jgi:hypothetical protein